MFRQGLWCINIRASRELIKADPSGGSRLHQGLLCTPFAKALHTRLQSHFGQNGPCATSPLRSQSLPQASRPKQSLCHDQKG